MSTAPALRGYAALGSARLRAMLQYRAVALAALATQVFWGLLRLMILDGFYGSAPHASDFSSTHYVSYIWLGQALFGLFPLSVDPLASERIRSGTVAYELLRPLDLYANWTISAIGWRIGRTVFRAAPLVLFAVLLPLLGRPEWALGPPADAAAALGFTELLGIVVLFSRFGSIRGWTVSEVALFYGVVHVVFAVAEGIGGGFESLESHVKNGTFDRVLLRPRSTLLQVLGSALAPETIGRLLLAALVLGWALAALDGGPLAGDIALLSWAFAGGVAAFFALLMLSAALSFWTTETLLIFAIVTKGGLETTQYPIAVFHRALRYLFLFLVILL